MFAHQLHVATSTARELHARHEVRDFERVLDKDSAGPFVFLGPIDANINQAPVFPQRTSALLAKAVDERPRTVLRQTDLLRGGTIQIAMVKQRAQAAQHVLRASSVKRAQVC